MKTLALYNIKGGVGKTAAAVNLSYLASREGARTLVWDLDPQGSATFYFRIRPGIKGGMKKALEKKKDLSQFVRETDFENLDVLPADFSNRYMDIILDGTGKPTRRLKKMLTPFESEYDFIFLDCPPSVSLTSEAVLFAADALIVPIIPTVLSVRTLEQLMDFQNSGGMGGHAGIYPFFSMVDRRKKLHCQIVEELPGQMDTMLAAVIPYSSAVEKMGLFRKPLASYTRTDKAVLAYEALWSEIREKTGN